MSKLNDAPSGVVPGTPDESEQSEVDTGGSSSVDVAMAHRQQIRHRVEKLEENKAERSAQREADTQPNRILT